VLASAATSKTLHAAVDVPALHGNQLLAAHVHFSLPLYMAATAPDLHLLLVCWSTVADRRNLNYYCWGLSKHSHMHKHEHKRSGHLATVGLDEPKICLQGPPTQCILPQKQLERLPVQKRQRCCAAVMQAPFTAMATRTSSVKAFEEPPCLVRNESYSFSSGNCWLPMKSICSR